MRFKRSASVVAMLAYPVAAVIAGGAIDTSVKTPCQNPLYISGTFGSYFTPNRHAGDLFSRDSYDYGLNYGFAVGQEVGKGFRYEGEFTYLSDGYFGWKMNGLYGSVRNLFGNIYYDFNREGFFSPYLGTGLGYTQVKTAITLADRDSYDTLGYQLSGGFRFNWGRRFGTELSYRYLGTAKNIVGLNQFSAHLINIKLHYRFA